MVPSTFPLLSHLVVDFSAVKNSPLFPSMACIQVEPTWCPNCRLVSCAYHLKKMANILVQWYYYNQESISAGGDGEEKNMLNFFSIKIRLHCPLAATGIENIVLTTDYFPHHITFVFLFKAIV